MLASHYPDFDPDGNTIMDIFKIGSDRIQIALFVLPSFTIVAPSAEIFQLREQLRNAFLIF